MVRMQRHATGSYAGMWAAQLQMLFGTPDTGCRVGPDAAEPLGIDSADSVCYALGAIGLQCKYLQPRSDAADHVRLFARVSCVALCEFTSRCRGRFR